MTEKTSLLEFPCDFPIKVFGQSGADFDALVAEVVRRHVPELKESAISTRPSKGGRYTAVTVNLRARSQAQLDAIYRDLSATPEILMVL
jgi:putative lipoic acid-binding regulatory protein